MQPLEIEEWLREAGRWPDGSLKAPDTRRANIVAFQRFQAWSIEFGSLDEPILDKIEKPRGNLRERIPTEDEINAISEGASPEFRLVYQALRRTGARPGELARLKIDNWDRDQNLLILSEHKTKRKTGRDRVIAVGEKLVPLLEEAIGDREEGPIFLSPRGRQWTTEGLSSTFRRLRKKLGLAPDLVLYLTRHEHASTLCRKLGIFAAQQALGHSNISTTQRYVKIDTQALKENQDAFD